MTDSLVSVAVWHRPSPKSRWIFWDRFRDGAAAAEAIRQAKAKGKIGSETLTVVGNRDPNDKESNG